MSETNTAPQNKNAQRILALLAACGERLTDYQIGGRLGLSTTTARRHCQALLAGGHLRSTTERLRYNRATVYFAPTGPKEEVAPCR